MKNITIVLLRSELNYLIKYDYSRISSDRIINLSYKEFIELDDNQKVLLLQNSLPIFEQDHEVILIEYNSILVSYDNAPLLEFKGILSIVPLSEMGARLLSSKLNTDFKILDPLDSQIYKAFLNNRNHLLRLRASKKLCEIYKVSLPNEEFINDFRIATLFQINDTIPTSRDSTLAHLLAFNVTPSFIPEGNIEAVIKTACVGMKKLNKEVDQITRSTFYSFVNKEKTVINRKSLFEAINFIEKKIEFNEDAKSKFDDLTRTLSEDGKYSKAFLLFSYFYFLKKEIEKNNYDISSPKKEILELRFHNPESASKVLFMLGYTFSIQTISKSIQSYSKSALLNNVKELDLEWVPKTIENPQSSNNKFNEDETKSQTNLMEDATITAEKTSSVAAEEILIKSKLDKNISSNKWKSSNAAELIDGDLFSHNTETENTAQFSYQKLERILKKRKGFLPKILNALKETGIPENEISKPTLIKCLIEIDEYEKQKGGIKVTALDALKIFE